MRTGPALKASRRGRTDFKMASPWLQLSRKHQETPSCSGGVCKYPRMNKRSCRKKMLMFFSLLNSKIKIQLAFAWVGNEGKIKTSRGIHLLGSGSCPDPDIKGKKSGKQAQWKQSVKVPSHPPPILAFGFSIALRLKEQRFSIPPKNAPVNENKQIN